MKSFVLSLSLGLALICLFNTVSGSKILFDGDPCTVKAKLTKDLMLSCCINDNPTTSTTSLTGGAVLVGRDVTTTSDGVITTTDDVNKVSSIVISKGGVDIASITEGVVKNLINDTSLLIDGHLTPLPGERGCLELTWMYPSEERAGVYECEANAIDDVGHNVVFSTKQEISVTQPTIMDLIDYIHVLESEVKHTETGRIECGNSVNDWGGLKYHDITQSFQRPYNQPPTVHIALVGDITYHDDPDRYNIKIIDFNETSFTVRCTTWADSQVYSMTVSWISVPN